MNLDGLLADCGGETSQVQECTLTPAQKAQLYRDSALEKNNMGVIFFPRLSPIMVISRLTRHASHLHILIDIVTSSSGAFLALAFVTLAFAMSF